jgi:hypothetical protein
MYITVTYAVYIILSLAITVWVGTTLFRNGRVFLREAFQGNKEVAESVNQLLLMAFYLINIGFIALFLRFGSKPTDWVQAVEYVSTKVGIVLVVSGGIHLFNMWNFANIRKKSGRPQVRLQTRPIRESQQQPHTV